MAAELIIRQAHLTSQGKEYVYLNTADLEYSCQYELDTSKNIKQDSSGLDTDGVGTSYSYAYKYSDPEYLWTFSDNQTSNLSEGTHKFLSLTEGSQQEVTATIKITIKETITTTTNTYDWVSQGMSGAWVKKQVDTGEVDENGDPIYKTEEVWDPDAGEEKFAVELISTSTSSSTNSLETSEDASFTVYTRPGLFSSYDFNDEDVICLNLTPSVINDWCIHCGKYLSWKHQEDRYNDATDEKYKRKGNDLITATWFNNQIAISESDMEPVVADITLIKTSLFKNLGAAISKDDTNDE